MPHRVVANSFRDHITAEELENAECQVLADKTNFFLCMCSKFKQRSVQDRYLTLTKRSEILAMKTFVGFEPISLEQ